MRECPKRSKRSRWISDPSRSFVLLASLFQLSLYLHLHLLALPRCCMHAQFTHHQYNTRGAEANYPRRPEKSQIRDVVLPTGFILSVYCTSHLMSLVQRLLPGLSTSLSSILRLSRMAAPPPLSSSPLSETPDDRPTKRAKMSDDPSCTTSAAVDMSPTDEAALVESIMADPLEYPKAAYYHDLDYRDKLVLAPMVRSGTCESLFHLLCSNDGS